MKVCECVNCAIAQFLAKQSLRRNASSILPNTALSNHGKTKVTKSLPISNNEDKNVIGAAVRRQ